MERGWNEFFQGPCDDGPQPAAPQLRSGGSELPSTGGSGDVPWTVSELLAAVRRALRRAITGRVRVCGEISNLKRPRSGHAYFRLKDADTAVDAVIFKRDLQSLKFRPADGLEVIAEGRVDVYEPRGQLQLYVERMQPRGQGALELAFRQMRERLEAEGLFARERKRPIPRFPRALGVVTSASGAAIRDIRRTLRRRWPCATVYLVPVLVQGDRAAGQIARALNRLDAAAARLGIDTILLARGGGSLEDLWAFNEEPVARAIFAARTPIVCGVGHEVDVTIADLVADLRAPTPTGAAERAAPDRREVSGLLAGFARRLTRAQRGRLDRAQAALTGLGRSAALRDPAYRVRAAAQRLDETALRLESLLRQRLADSHRALAAPANRLAGLHPLRLRERAAARVDRLRHRLAWALSGRAQEASRQLAELGWRLRAVRPQQRLQRERDRLDALARQLEALSHRSALRRGFSVTRGSDGRILRSVQQVREGEKLRTELADGAIDSRVSGRKAPGADETPLPDLSGRAAPRRPRKTKDAGPRGPGLFDS